MRLQSDDIVIVAGVPALTPVETKKRPLYIVMHKTFDGGRQPD